MGDPGVDIARTLERLEVDIRTAVSSYVGMTVTDRSGGYRFTVMSPGTVSASLGMPIAGASVILYATQPGAFVDLAADLTWLTATSDVHVLDAHLIPPKPGINDGSVLRASTIDQAVGVLVGRGRTFDEARAHLDTLAADSATDVLGAARAVLTALDGT